MKSGTRPNILILITDQQSHTMLSAAGNAHLKTPALDRLAAEGIRFTRAYCSNPVCVPSRFSMLTGMMPSAIGMRANGDSALTPLPPEHEKQGLGWKLREAGYRTYYGGKVHLPLGLTPERLGFETYSTDEREVLAEAASGMLEGKLQGPWAMVVSLINPHDICYHAIRDFAKDGDKEKPWIARAVKELSALDEALVVPGGQDGETLARQCPPLPPNHEVQHDEPSLIGELITQRAFRRQAREQWKDAQWRHHRWAYARLTERVDRHIGDILGALDRSGQAGETLVLMTSDHGDMDGAHRLEHKTVFYDESARVPFLMRLPGRIAPGQVADKSMVATGLDLLATCCDYAGVPLPAFCRGMSQRAVAEGQAGAVGRDHVYLENSMGTMVATPRFKYSVYDSGEGRVQLQDLDADPGEMENHIARHRGSAELGKLEALLAAEQKAHASLAYGPSIPSGRLE